MIGSRMVKLRLMAKPKPKDFDWLREIVRRWVIGSRMVKPMKRHWMMETNLDSHCWMEKQRRRGILMNSEIGKHLGFDSMMGRQRRSEIVMRLGIGWHLVRQMRLGIGWRLARWRH